MKIYILTGLDIKKKLKIVKTAGKTRAKLIKEALGFQEKDKVWRSHV